MKTRILVCLFLPLLAIAVRGQDVDPESEDIIELSPFLVTSEGDGAYSAAGALAGARMAMNLVEPNAAVRVPNVPVTITKRAGAVAVSFALVNTGDKQEKRNSELYGSVESLRAEIARVQGLRLEHREVRFASGNRSRVSFSRTGATTSYASVLILADLPQGVDVVALVKTIRDTVQKATLQGQTKIIDGVVGMYLKDTQKYRREILDVIFADIEGLKKSLGPDFEVLVSGLNQPVRARICSETDVELWLDYSFSIRSIRELAKK